jgi:hypothetical protein
MERVKEFCPYDLNMRRNDAKYMPRLFSNDLKDCGIAVCTELKEQAENNSHFISNIITESSLYLCTGQPLPESDHTRCCVYTTDLLMMSIILFETCRGLYYTHIIKNKELVHQVGD